MYVGKTPAEFVKVALPEGAGVGVGVPELVDVAEETRMLSVVKSTHGQKGTYQV